MQNEFEKQVQQKMEELNFVPSPPVWQNIEEQIRKKKERRRAIFWIPFGILLLTGAGWWIMNQGGWKGDQGPETESPVQLKKNLPAQNDIQKEHQNIHENDIIARKNDGIATPAQTINQSPGSKELSSDQTVTKENFNRPEKLVTVNFNSQGNKESSAKNQPVVLKHTTRSPVHDQGGLQPVNEELTSDRGKAENRSNSRVEENNTHAVIEKLPAQIVKTPSENKEANEVSISKDSIKKQDTIIKDVVTIELPAEMMKPAAKASKWTFGVAAGIGFSGEGNGIRLNDEKSFLADQLSSGAPASQVAPKPGSEINKNISYSASLLIKKNLGPRVSFASGLGYQYYSSQRNVGKFVQDSTLPAGGVLEQFYLNAGPSTNEAVSKYHFITLPLSFNWKISKNLPVYAQAGLSIQHLIASDAFQYDKGNSVYYKNHELLKKTQLFSNFGLGYEFSFKNNKSLLLGPSLQYGLSEMTEMENKHLFYLGMNAQFFFNKK